MKTLATVLEENKELIVAFHIGKGGRFNNSGHLSYIGENDINNFTNDLFLSEDESEYLDLNGEKVGLLVDNNGIGYIDIDGQYDTTYTTTVGQMTDEEVSAVMNRGFGWYGTFAEELSEVTETEIED
jgi:hypothetical protein